jgi:hypothetical protein
VHVPLVLFVFGLVVCFLAIGYVRREDISRADGPAPLSRRQIKKLRRRASKG